MTKYSNDLQKAINYVIDDFREMAGKNLFDNTEEYNAGIYIDDSLYEFANRMENCSIKKIMGILATFDEVLIEKAFDDGSQAARTFKDFLNEIYQDLIYKLAIPEIEKILKKEFPNLDFKRG